MWAYRLNHVVGPVVGSYWPLRLEGAIGRVPADGPLILAANHSSVADPWLVGMVFPRLVRYLITHEWYHRSPVWRAVFRSFGTEPVKAADPDATIDAVCAILARGEVCGIFPEGRLSVDGRIQRFRPGISRIAARSGAPVMPVGIRGSFESLPIGGRWPRRRPVRICLGEPFGFPGAPMAGPPPRPDSVAFADRLFDAICELSGREPGERATSSRRARARAGAAP